jgi:hypothetical protein
MNNRRGCGQMFFKKYKILGKVQLSESKFNEMVYYVPRYCVKIKKPKNYTDDLLEKLIYLEMSILKVSKKHLQILLPPGWYMFKCSMGQYISDDIFRLRITITKNEIYLFKRYAFAMTYDKEETEKIKCVLLDGGVPTYEIPIGDKFKNTATTVDGDIDKLIDIYTEGCLIYMNEHIPLWQDELSYWEESEEEELSEI